jgi:hypothetical protein
MCNHKPECPNAKAIDHDAAKALIHDYNLGATLLCNGVLVFDDSGELVPDDEGYGVIEPYRAPAPHVPSNAILDLKLLALETQLKLMEARAVDRAKAPAPIRKVWSIDPASVGWLVCLVSLVTAETWAVLSAFVK